VLRKERQVIRRDFLQVSWTDELEDDVRNLVRLAVAEDLGARGDLTSQCTISDRATGKASMVARRGGTLAGILTVDVILSELSLDVQWTRLMTDGAVLQAGSVLGCLQGRVRDILSVERIILNFVGRLSGIATLARRYVEAVQGTSARIYDTRKTTPGWRRLEKYAVRCGGGYNHRLGLDHAVLIKDNHLAWLATELGCSPEHATRMAIRRAREYFRAGLGHAGQDWPQVILEIEVDSLSQFESVLCENPDIVLLDNMSPEELRKAVNLRNQVAPQVELEASGGVTLENVRAIAETGVERISVGALTHAAPWLDIALDWETPRLSESG